MRAIGVRELKAHLSRILREVQAGESVLVTDRGRVIAELRQPGVYKWTDSPTVRALRELAEEGSLSLGEPSQGDAYPPSPVTSPEGTARTLLDEERGER